MLISLLTGFAAGAIHVVGGVDHLVAMAPISLRRPGAALRGGLAWGLGHSMGVLVLSTIAILVKDFAQIELMSSWAEFSVGVGLLIVGALAIKTSLGLDIHTHSHKHGNSYSHNHVHFHLRGKQKHSRHPHAATSLGLLHGLAGASHFIAVLPALALPPLWAVAYLVTYLIGSVFAMGVVVIAISFASLKAGNRAMPFLVGLTGGFSIVTGFFWLHKTSEYIF